MTLCATLVACRMPTHPFCSSDECRFFDCLPSAWARFFLFPYFHIAHHHFPRVECKCPSLFLFFLLIEEKNMYTEKRKRSMVKYAVCVIFFANLLVFLRICFRYMLHFQWYTIFVVLWIRIVLIRSHSPEEKSQPNQTSLFIYACHNHPWCSFMRTMMMWFWFGLKEFFSWLEWITAFFLSQYM